MVTELAIVLLHVDSEKPAATPDPDGRPPVIAFDPDHGHTWQKVKEQIARSGAAKIFVQFSNETIAIPQHGWTYIEWPSRQYRRLYDAGDLIASTSPLACIPLSPLLALPDLHIETREIRDGEHGWADARLLYYFDTNNWIKLENKLEKDDEDAGRLFALSCLYDKTNRIEEAYATSRKALSLNAAGPAPAEQGCDTARLWLAHGLHAAQCGLHEEAAAAFRMSDTERRSMEPLYAWADERMRQGWTGDEATAPIEQWLEHDPDKKERLIFLLHKIGRYEKALKMLESAKNTAPPLIHIRFACLIRAGRLSEAVLLIRGMDDDYRRAFPQDDLMCKLLLADDKAATAMLAAALAPHELQTLLERTVELHLFERAEQLRPFLANPLSLAFALFDYGYVMRAAAYFLQALKDNALDPAGYRCLAEILYYRGAYEQASGMFEYLLAQKPDDASLRTALALACLRQSEALLSESMSIFPSSVFLREEADKVAAGIRKMEQSAAITRWRWAERANFHE